MIARMIDVKMWSQQFDAFAHYVKEKYFHMSVILGIHSLDPTIC